MPSSQTQHVYELLPSGEDASKLQVIRPQPYSRFLSFSNLAAMLLTTCFLVIALTLAYT